MSDQQDTEYRYATGDLPDGGIHTGVSIDQTPAPGRIGARLIPAHPVRGYEDTIVPERIAVTFHSDGSQSEMKFTPEQWRAVIGLVQELMPAEVTA